MKISKLPLNLPLTTVSGIIVIFGYLLFTLVALSLYSTPYSPLNNWISDLGSSASNPSGALFFNLGCVITGIMLFPFFAGLYKWYTPERRIKIPITVAQGVGIISAVSLIMIGVFSEDYGFIHWLWSAIFFLSLVITLGILNTSLFNHPQFIRLVGYYGLLVVLVGLILVLIDQVNTVLPAPLFEWVTVLTALIWVGAFSYNTMKLKNAFK
jgi:hypothetical membrane protein